MLFGITPVEKNGSLGEPIPLYWAAAGIITSDWVPMGTFRIVEHTTQSTIGNLDRVAGRDITVLIHE